MCIIWHVLELIFLSSCLIVLNAFIILLKVNIEIFCYIKIYLNPKYSYSVIMSLSIRQNRTIFDIVGIDRFYCVEKTINFNKLRISNNSLKI